MKMDRRQLVVGAGLFGLAGTAPPLLAAGQAGQPAAATPPSPLIARLAETAAANRLRLDHHAGRFSGPGWERLVAAGREAHFFLLGEQHGISENAALAAALFTALVPAGYERVAVEVSPPMASEMDQALIRGGSAELRRMLGRPGSATAFFGMREEAAWLAAARAALPDARPFLWGLDYEVAADRHLIALLKPRPKPAAAQRALAALEAASNASWAMYETTRGPQHIFSFAGDPALVRAVSEAWPDADEASAEILRTLEETLAINRLWGERKGWESNERRTRLLKTNFLNHWRAETQKGTPPRVFMKFGASHMVRGLSMTHSYDLGTLIPELAEQAGKKAFSLLVLNGPGTMTAQFDPSAFRYQSGPEGSFHSELAPIVDRALPDAFSLFDMRPLRGLARPGAPGLHAELLRVVHGFDAVLVMSGSTPSTNL